MPTCFIVAEDNTLATSAGQPSAAPESSGDSLTAIERIAARLPGPYLIWAFVLAGVLGVPGFIVARYLDTGILDRALSLFPLLVPNIVTYNLANFGLTLYALVGIRFMRTRTLAVTRQLAPLLPEGTRAPHGFFAPMTWTAPPLILTPVLLAVSFAAFPDQVQDITGTAYLVLRVIQLPVTYFIYATFIWVYLSAIRGLDLLGRMPLRLPSFLEDSHLGLKPFGSLSLVLALVYLVGLGLVAFSFLSVPPIIVGLIAALAIPGILLFFLPLLALRQRMIKEEREAGIALAAAYMRARPLLDPFQSLGNPAASEGVRTLLALQILEHRVSDLSRWPLDLRMMSWFSAILLSVLAAIATRYVLAYLGI